MQLPDLSEFLPRLLAALPVALIVIVAAFVVMFVVTRLLRLLAARTSLTEADLLPVRNILKWLIIIAAVLAILTVFGFQLGGVWTMLSTVLAMVAIGFVAVWSLISHTSATLLILVLRPFQVGDEIEFAGEAVQGKVIDLNFFFTTLQTGEGQLVQIPNNLFFQKVLKRRPGTHSVSLAHQLNAASPHRR